MECYVCLVHKQLLYKLSKKKLLYKTTALTLSHGYLLSVRVQYYYNPNSETHDFSCTPN
jgi:hypothetical protein